MKKNDTFEIEITDLGTHGEGIGRFDGMTFFIKDAIVGDRVLASAMKLKKSYGYARIVEILEPSKNRVEPKCPIAKTCGGCQIQNMDYQAQLAWKEQMVKNDLVRLGGFDQAYIDSISESIIGMENPWRYRNKAQYPVGLDKNGEIVMGFYASHSHRIIDAEDCYLGAEENHNLLEAVKSWMVKNHVKPYDEVTGKGLVRHVLIRQGVHTDQTMVCLIINGTKIPDESGLIAYLKAASERIYSISLNVNKKRNNVILGEETRTIWGEDTITDKIGDISFRISPKSFFQVNPEQMEKLYQKALEYAGLTGTEYVYDLYCGIGTISLFLAKKAGHVTGIEIVPEAIQDAKENATRNAIGNADFFAGATEDVLPKLVREGNKADVIMLDPPRKGCEASVIETILGEKPERIVYVSCDPATMARDLKLFCASGEYQLTKACAVDQFGHTAHCEAVVKLERI